MPIYAAATIPFISSLPSRVQQVWYADDAAASGKTKYLRTGWDKLLSLGPAYGYYPNAQKTWLIVKTEHKASAEAAFLGTQINVTTEGRPHLGVPLGCKEYCEQFIKGKVNGWCGELEKLSLVAETQPHAAYAAATHRLASKWNYLYRTTCNINDLLIPLEDMIRKKSSLPYQEDQHPTMRNETSWRYQQD